MEPRGRLGRIVVGVDTGGTFTDFVCADGHGLRIHKQPSTPSDPAEAVLEGLRMVAGREAAEIVHGSTVATNALLERRGARTALLTTAGFEDVLEIGRQARRAIYDLDVDRAPPLVPPELRLGLRERLGPRGEVLVPLAPETVAAACDRLAATGVEAVAICLLHAYANPEHERLAAEAVRERLGVFLSTSHQVLPEFREYERCSTTVVNAYVGPVMARYLATLAAAVDGRKVRVMQSNGGLISLEAARRLAVQTILSGPAGGALGGFEIARGCGYDRVVTFDMGGTSTDVSLCPGRLTHTTESVIGEAPIRLPVIDVHTVGAGGGSVAYRDPGGSLRVGPRSAGAEPGPICYGAGGTELTVTDANLYLGRLSPDHFLGGHQRLQLEPVREAMDAFAARMGLPPVQAAEGILQVANATMERAMRVISMERGHDPRDFTLVCFGGAGAMHAADLARDLGFPRVVVPQAAGTLSALGMLLADFVRDYTQTLLVGWAELDPRELERAFGELEERARREYAGEGFAPDQVIMERSVDMRYVGQGYELSIPWGDDLLASFHAHHQRRYGYADAHRPVELVNIRLRAVGRTDKPLLPEHDLGEEDPSAAIVGECRMVFSSQWRSAPLLQRAKLQPGNAFAGPALVVEYSTTTVVPPDYRCRVDRQENLVLEPLREAAGRDGER